MTASGKRSRNGTQHDPLASLKRQRCMDADALKSKIIQLLNTGITDEQWDIIDEMLFFTHEIGKEDEAVNREHMFQLIMKDEEEE